MTNYFSLRFSNKIFLVIMSVCQRRTVPCWCHAGKAASREECFGVRFSAPQADGAVGCDVVSAGVVLSPWLLESQGGCADGGEVVTLSESSVPVLCEVLPLHLLFCWRKKKKKRHQYRSFFYPVWCLV